MSYTLKTCNKDCLLDVTVRSSITAACSKIKRYTSSSHRIQRRKTSAERIVELKCYDDYNDVDKSQDQQHQGGSMPVCAFLRVGSRSERLKSVWWNCWTNFPSWLRHQGSNTQYQIIKQHLEGQKEWAGGLNLRWYCGLVARFQIWQTQELNHRYSNYTTFSPDSVKWILTHKVTRIGSNMGGTSLLQLKSDKRLGKRQAIEFFHRSYLTKMSRDFKLWP